MKRLNVIFAAVSALLMMWACEPAEVSYNEYGYAEGLYTVNKATVKAEFGDTALFMRNFDDYKHTLKTGDHAWLRLRFDYDAYSGQPPVWCISEIIEVVPTYPLSVLDSAAIAQYDTPFTALKATNLGIGKWVAAWVWNGRQNLNLSYRGTELDAEFAMVVRGYNEGCVELELLAKAAQGTGDTDKLLVFDLTNVADFLPVEVRDSLPKGEDFDKIKTRVFYKYLDKKGNVNEVNILGNNI